MTLFNERDHTRLATLFDSRSEIDRHGDLAATCDSYPGYKPEVREAPNGDTKACPDCRGGGFGGGPEGQCHKCDGFGKVPNVDAGPAGKRYLHVALKYTPPAWAVEYLARAHYEACRVAEALGVPAAYYPRVADGTLRVLEYPSAGHMWEPDATTHGDLSCKFCHNGVDDGRACPALALGAGTAEHTDFDLFTIVLWRSTPDDLERDYWPSDAGPGEPSPRDLAEAISPGLHIGEIGELVGLGPATPHRVPARPYAQKSIVYFAMPDHGARLPCTSCLSHGAAQEAHRAIGCAGAACGFGLTVGDWLRERLNRSRVVYK